MLNIIRLQQQFYDWNENIVPITVTRNIFIRRVPRTMALDRRTRYEFSETCFRRHESPVKTSYSHFQRGKKFIIYKYLSFSRNSFFFHFSVRERHLRQLCARHQKPDKIVYFSISRTRIIYFYFDSVTTYENIGKYPFTSVRRQSIEYIGEHRLDWTDIKCWNNVRTFRLNRYSTLIFTNGSSVVVLNVRNCFSEEKDFSSWRRTDKGSSRIDTRWRLKRTASARLEREGKKQSAGPWNTYLRLSLHSAIDVATKKKSSFVERAHNKQ